MHHLSPLFIAHAAHFRPEWAAPFLTLHRLPAIARGVERRAGLVRLHWYRARPAALPPELAAQLHVRELDPAEAVEHCGNARADSSPEWVREAIARGDRCLGAFWDGSFAASMWIAARAAPLVDGVDVEVAPGVEYRYKMFVLPEFRRRGIASALYRTADWRMGSGPSTHALLCIAPGNRASATTALAAGAEWGGQLILWRAGRWLVPLHARGVHEAGLGFSCVALPQEAA